jgi:hypothetical protein
MLLAAVAGISLVIAGPATPATLHAVAEQARMDLLAAGGLTQVEVEGLPPLELSVEIDRDTLKAYGLSLDDDLRHGGGRGHGLPGVAVYVTLLHPGGVNSCPRPPRSRAGSPAADASSG